MGLNGLKRKIYKKLNKRPQVFIQFTNVPNFNMIGSFFTSLGCPKVLGKNGSQGPKNEYLKKASLGIHPIHKCVKFQRDCAILFFSRLLQSFREKLVPRTYKGRFSKKSISRYSYNPQVCQISA